MMNPSILKSIALVAVLLSGASAFAESTFHCATGLGSYDEVQKFQIAHLQVQVPLQGSLQTVGMCLEEVDQMTCSFKTRHSFREYSLMLKKVDGSDGQMELHGRIDQAFRKSGVVRCTSE